MAPLSSSRWRAAVSSSQSPKAISLPASVICRLGGSARVRRKMAFDARQQPAGHKGFNQIIVSPHFRAEDPVAVVGAGGEHQHRNILLRVGAQLAAERCRPRPAS